MASKARTRGGGGGKKKKKPDLEPILEGAESKILTQLKEENFYIL